MKLEKKTIQNDEQFLRQISKNVDFKNDEWKKALEKVDYYCKNDDNIMALASVQIDVPLRLIYLKKTNLDKLEEDYNESKVLINPEIVKDEGLTRYWEACASCLDYTGLVERPYRIVVKYDDINGKKHYELFEGFESTVLKHEMDHLDGILHMDIALELLNMNKDERKEFRKTHPYEIIKKDGDFIKNKQKILKKITDS